MSDQIERRDKETTDLGWQVFYEWTLVSGGVLAFVQPEGFPDLAIIGVICTGIVGSFLRTACWTIMRLIINRAKSDCESEGR